MITVSLPDRVLPPGLSPPDIGWNGFVGDFVEGPTGLVAANPIRTAISMLLFTNAACERAELRFEHGGDRRGWAGDGFGIDPAKGEQPLGSTLWLLRRQVLNEAVARRAEAETVRALQPLVRQKVAEKVTAEALIAAARDRIEMTIGLNTRSGRPVFSDRFDIVWKAAA